MTKGFLVGLCAGALVTSVVAAQSATRLKPMMNDWKANVQRLDAALAEPDRFNAAEVKLALDAFAAGAHEVAQRIKPTSSEAADVKARFLKFADASLAASDAAASSQALKPRYAEVRAACKSCHSVYAN